MKWTKKKEEAHKFMCLLKKRKHINFIINCMKLNSVELFVWCTPELNSPELCRCIIIECAAYRVSLTSKIVLACFVVSSDKQERNNIRIFLAERSRGSSSAIRSNKQQKYYYDNWNCNWSTAWTSTSFQLPKRSSHSIIFLYFLSFFY